MNIIVAVDRNWGIGRENELLFRIPEDQKFFRTMTTGKVIIIGGKTLDSFPDGKPLPNRKNIVLTRRDLTGYENELAIVHNLNELLAEIKKYDFNDIFVSGGQQIYNLLIDYCSTAYVTRINVVRAADRFFPNLDLRQEWVKTDESEEKEYEDLKYCFQVYKRKD